jgi:S1-C subfamily serine protease
MKRVAVYSDSRARPGFPQPQASPQVAESRQETPKPASRHRRALIGAVVALLVLALGTLLGLAPRGLSQAEVDAVVQRALEGAAASRPLASDAYEKIMPSVVHVRGLLSGADEQKAAGKDEHAAAEGNVGTGVVIVDTGIILTNLHVVEGAKRIRVTFFDGLEADAEVIGLRPDDDLAVLQAKKVPDDLFPATLRSTSGLRPGDEVVAVGFPFGIGPSASAGVVSGLKREYESQGKRVLTNLIQFDAAVNPGNSGGPLVTLDGEVVGIVTGLLNPTEQRVFVGIGFAVPIENAAGAIGLNPF